MTIFHGKMNIKKDLEKVRATSVIVEKKMESFEPKIQSKIDSLTPEELQDFDQILKIADYMLCKYENQQEMHSLLKDFVLMIQHSANYSEILKDKIDEMSFSAENSVQKIKSLQGDVAENGPNNLTYSSTPFHITEYQQKFGVQTR